MLSSAMPSHAGSTSTVMEGLLEKPSTGFSGLGPPRWQPRHFVLRDDGQLQRFATSDTSGVPQAVLHLGELASTVAESGREMRIMLKDGGEVHLRAVDDSGAHDWVAAIRRAIAQSAVPSTAQPSQQQSPTTAAGGTDVLPKLPHLLHVPASPAGSSPILSLNTQLATDQEPGQGQGQEQEQEHGHGNEHQLDRDRDSESNHPDTPSSPELQNLEILRKKCAEMEKELLEQQQHMKATSRSHAQALAAAQSSQNAAAARLAKLADEHVAATADAAAAHRKKDTATAELRERCITAQREQLRLQEQCDAAVAAAVEGAATAAAQLAQERQRHEDELTALKAAQAQVEAKHDELERNMEALCEQRGAAAAAAAEERVKRECERFHEQHAAEFKQHEAESAAAVQASTAARAAEAHAHTAALGVARAQHDAQVALLREEHDDELAVLRGEHALLLDTRAAEVSALEAKCMLLEQEAEQHRTQHEVGDAVAAATQAALAARLRAAETEATTAVDTAARTAEALKRQLAERDAKLEQLKESHGRQQDQAQAQAEALEKSQGQIQAQAAASQELVRRNESLQQQLSDERRKLKETEERHASDIRAMQAQLSVHQARESDTDGRQENDCGVDEDKGIAQDQDMAKNQDSAGGPGQGSGSIAPKQQDSGMLDACRAKLSALVCTMQAQSSNPGSSSGNGSSQSLYQQLLADIRVTLADRPVQGASASDLRARCYLVEALSLLSGCDDAHTEAPGDLDNDRAEQAAAKVTAAAGLRVSVDVLMVRAVTEAAPPRSKWNAAADTLRAATKVDAADSGAWFRLGLVLSCTESGLRAYDEGEAALRRCLKMRQSHALAHLRLGILLKGIRKLPGEAEKCYRRAIHANPKLPSAYTSLGVLLQTRRKPKPDVEAAEAAYRQSLELDGNSTDSVMAHANLGLLLRGANRFSEAEKCYRRATELDPNSAARHVRLGVLLHEDLGRVDDAEQCLRRALKVQPPVGSGATATTAHSAARAQAYAALGAVLQSQDRSAGPDCAAAEDAFRSSVELEPMRAARHLDLGRFLFGGKSVATPADINAAEQCLRRALVLDDSYAAAYAALGELLDSARKDHAAALACFTKAISLETKVDSAGRKRELVAAYKGLGVHLGSTGDTAGAEEQLRKAVRAAPGDADAHLRLGTLLLKQASDSKRADEAEHHLHEALKLEPGNALAHNNLGLLLKSAKRDLEGAEKAYRAAVELDSTYVKARMNLGLLLKQTKRAAEAEQQFKRAIELDPTNALAHNNYGTSLQERGDIDGAESSFRAAIKVAPNNALAHGNLGLLLETARADVAAAEACYRRAVELKPEDEWAQKKLIRALRTRARSAEHQSPDSVEREGEGCGNARSKLGQQQQARQAQQQQQQQQRPKKKK